MLAENIISEVKSILEADTTLKAYIRNVYLGLRDNVPDEYFPSIFLEPLNDGESKLVYNTQRLTFTIMINAFVKITDPDKQIIGDDDSQGIMDITQDIKKALSAYETLNGKCIYFSFPNTRYEFSNYPIRGVAIEMSIYYEQDWVNRT